MDCTFFAYRDGQTNRSRDLMDEGCGAFGQYKRLYEVNQRLGLRIDAAGRDRRFNAMLNAVAPLRQADPAQFGPLWSGQAAALGRELPAAELTRRLAEEALARLSTLSA